MYQTAKMITDDYSNQITSRVIDSKGSSLVIEYLVMEALDMLAKGIESQELCNKLNWLARESTIYLTVSDLENLVKGGRFKSESSQNR